jgi:hypothetical protein
MTARIEDYALLGDLQTAALVDRNGSIDWLCFPRFDSGACFAALLGDPDCGRWLLAPSTSATSARRYLHDTLVLETTWTTEDGEGVKGRVDFRSELTIRFDYGRIVPWVRKRTHEEDTRVALAGPEALCFRTHAPTRGEALSTISELAVDEGERVPFASSPGSLRTRTFPRRSTPSMRSPTPNSSGVSGARPARSTCPPTGRRSSGDR